MSPSGGYDWMARASGSATKLYRRITVVVVVVVTGNRHLAYVVALNKHGCARERAGQGEEALERRRHRYAGGHARSSKCCYWVHFQCFDKALTTDNVKGWCRRRKKRKGNVEKLKNISDKDTLENTDRRTKLENLPVALNVSCPWEDSCW